MIRVCRTSSVAPAGSAIAAGSVSPNHGAVTARCRSTTPCSVAPATSTTMPGPRACLRNTVPSASVASPHTCSSFSGSSMPASAVSIRSPRRCNARTLNRRGLLMLTAEAGIELPLNELQVWGEATLADGTVLRRQARGPGMVVDVAGATEQGVVDRQRAVTAPWLGLTLPAAMAEPAGATLEVRQTRIIQMEEGARYEYAFQWTLHGRGTPPKQVGVDVIGAKDIRVIDIKAGTDDMAGTFAVTTTKANDPARYDLYVSGRLKTDDGDESIVSRPIAFEVSGGTNVASK